MVRQGRHIAFFVLAVLVLSCEQDVSSFQDIALFENVMLRSSNRVILSARIVEKSSTLSDHGFEIDETIDFNNPVKLSKGESDVLGLFFAEYENLKPNRKYYVRAYIISENGESFSINIDSLITAIPRVDEYSLEYGNPGDILTIRGNSFTNDIEVSFSGQKVPIIAQTEDFEIKVEVPDHEGIPFATIEIDMDDYRFNKDSFEYISGKWTQLDDFEFDSFFKPVQFKYTDRFVIGMGHPSDSSSLDKFYEYDFEGEEWRRMAVVNEMIPSNGSFYTRSGYIGSGAYAFDPNGDPLIHNEFARFNGLDSLELIGTIPYFGYRPLAFEYDREIHIIGGTAENHHVYNLEDNTWSINGTSYLTGSAYPHGWFNNRFLFLDRNRRILEFNFQTRMIEVRGLFEADVLEEGIMQVIENELYIGLMFARNALYRMHPQTYELTPTTPFPGNPTFLTVASFVWDNELYILKSPFSSGINTMEFWKFEPYVFPD